MADQVQVNAVGILVAYQAEGVQVNTTGVLTAYQGEGVQVNTTGVLVAYGTERVETSQLFTQVEYSSPPQVETSQLFAQVEYTPSRVEISRLITQVEWEPPAQVEISRLITQVEWEPPYTAVAGLSVNVGTIQSGNVNSIQLDDASNLVVQETATTPGLNIGFTFSGVNTEKPKVIHFKAWYDSDPSYTVKLQVKKNDQTWEDVFDALFPNATEEGSYNWNLPTPITDYVYDSLLQVRAYQEGNGSTSRKLYVNFTSLTDKSGSGGGLKISRGMGI